MKKYFLVNTLISALIFLFIILTGSMCSEKTNPAQTAYEQAKALEKEGRILEALARYESLAAYPDSPFYLQAEKELLARGYTIKAARSSWTAKKQIEIQNKINRYYKAHKAFPAVENLGDLTDGWGRPMTIQYQPTPRHLYRINSLGPDSTAGTADDIVLAFKDQFEFESSAPQKSGSDEMTMDLNQLKKLNTSQTEETIMDLEQLKQFQNDSTGFSEKTMDLKSLLEKNQ